jgi:hypothetical protein
MNDKLSKYFEKLYVKRWTIGISRCSIESILRTKVFNPDITWLTLGSLNKFYADPFLYMSKEGDPDIFLEEFSINENYGKLSVLRVDENFNRISYKTLLDTNSHLSYPFIFIENKRTFLFPEASRTGKLSCYEYDSVNNSLIFLQDVLDLPLVDSTIIKHNNIYWIFGALGNQESSVSNKDFSSRLYIFFSDSLLGPYAPHPGNPVKNSLNGSRPAGNFIELDGVLFRPSQNCENKYGESITINKVNELNESRYSEEPYMLIKINKENKSNNGVHSIHTMNVLGNFMVVDGEKWTFTPLNKLISYFKKRIGKNSNNEIG